MQTSFTNIQNHSGLDLGFCAKEFPYKASPIYVLYNLCHKYESCFRSLANKVEIRADSTRAFHMSDNKSATPTAKCNVVIPNLCTPYVVIR